MKSSSALRLRVACRGHQGECERCGPLCETLYPTLNQIETLNPSEWQTLCVRQAVEPLSMERVSRLSLRTSCPGNVLMPGSQASYAVLCQQQGTLAVVRCVPCVYCCACAADSVQHWC
jgi:hypothetical protein